MTYRATVVNVMIASPGDVATERQIARQVIAEWNAVNSTVHGLVLYPLGWETDAAPAVDAEGPQAVINKQVLTRADLLVAIFGNRLGSPTSSHRSGTVEEIERHVAAKKEALIYFSDVPTNTSKIDLDQLKDLRAFKESLNKRGLYAEYGSSPDFEKQLRQHLSFTIQRTFLSSAARDNPAHLSESARGRAPNLSDSARELLLAAANSPKARLTRIPEVGRVNVFTDEREFVERNDPRSEAKWDAALSDLVKYSYVKQTFAAGDARGYAVTDGGFARADEITAAETL